jgi:hypothetical protein
MCLLPCRPEECEGQAHVSYLCIRDLPVILGGLFRLSCPIPVPSLRHFERSREISRSLGTHRELPATAGGCAEARPFPEGILRQARSHCEDDNGTTLSGETGNGPFGPDASLSIAKNPRAQHSESARQRNCRPAVPPVMRLTSASNRARPKCRPAANALRAGILQVLQDHRRIGSSDRQVVLTCPSHFFGTAVGMM